MRQNAFAAGVLIRTLPAVFTEPLAGLRENRERAMERARDGKGTEGEGKERQKGAGRQNETEGSLRHWP